MNRAIEAAIVAPASPMRSPAAMLNSRETR